VCEVSVRVLEPRPIAKGSVDLVSAVGVGQWIHVDFHRLDELVRWVRDLAMDRLAADDHEFIESDGVSGGAYDMVEVFAAQLPNLRKDLAPLSFCKCAGEWRGLAQIPHTRTIGAQRSPYLWNWPIEYV
jgi:hypothetical protein